MTVTSLTGSEFSLTKLKNQTSYLEMAWLITKMTASPQDQKAAYQYAIWSFTGGPDPYHMNSILVAQALAAASTFNAAGWEILTPTGSAGQEFLIFVGVAEPSELVMLLLGAIVALATRKKRGRLTQAA